MPQMFRSLVVSGDEEFKSELAERAIGLDFSVRSVRSSDELPGFLEGRHFDWLFLDVEIGHAQCLQIIETLSPRLRPRTVLVGAIDEEGLKSIRRNAGLAGMDVVGILMKPLSLCALATQLTALQGTGKHSPNADLAARGLDAIPSSEIEVHYQPIVSISDRVVRRTEALVRWQHPEYGLMHPDEFIGLAERSGAIVPLTWDVLARAIDQHVAWTKEGLQLSVSVNMSTLVLTSPEIAGSILSLLKEKGAAPRSLILEITETERAPDPTIARGLLARLREAGVGISMDDYGVGFSDFGRLRYYPFTDLKMDRSLVARLPGGQESKDIVSALVSLTVGEGIGLTGEGVETQAQWDALEALGCNFAQGFLIARPMPADQVSDWIARMADAGLYWPAKAG
ncbi:EAL domain-containing protein [Reyranella sp.]|uniref:EAL domain-containing protein n=1 Tax=Reyranella sp. TaxID=1929291 RepID=UPI003BAD9BAE